MKKLFILSLILFIFLLTIFGCIKPELVEEEDEEQIVESEILEEDFLIPGHTYEITWVSYNTERISIELYGVEKESGNGDLIKVMTICEETEDDGSFDWVIPIDFEDLYNENFDSTYYKISITSNTKSRTIDFLENTFTIKYPYIEIKQTNYINDIIAGEEINFIISNTEGNFKGKLELYKNDDECLNIIDYIDFSENNEIEIIWDVPHDILIDDDYSMKIIDIDTDCSYETSLENFTILPNIIINCLETNEMIKAGTEYNINWEYTGIFSNIDIYLKHKNGVINLIADGIDNTGSYTYKIPEVMMMKDFKIMIIPSDFGESFYESTGFLSTYMEYTTDEYVEYLLDLEPKLTNGKSLIKDYIKTNNNINDKTDSINGDYDCKQDTGGGEDDGDEGGEDDGDEGGDEGDEDYDDPNDPSTWEEGDIVTLGEGDESQDFMITDIVNDPDSDEYYSIFRIIL